MDLGLAGRAVLITGPAKGMGAAISLAFAREGCRLALVGRDLAVIEPVADAARRLGVEASVMRCDLTDTSACESTIAAAETAFGGLDVLVNVAGGSGPIGKTGWETTRPEFDEIVTLNMAGCFNTMRAALPGMVARALRQDRQCRRHVRHARPGWAHGLLRLQMGPARHYQVDGAGGRAV